MLVSKLFVDRDNGEKESPLDCVDKQQEVTGFKLKILEKIKGKM